MNNSLREHNHTHTTMHTNDTENTSYFAVPGFFLLFSIWARSLLCCWFKPYFFCFHHLVHPRITLKLSFLNIFSIRSVFSIFRSFSDSLNSVRFEMREAHQSTVNWIQMYGTTFDRLGYKHGAWAICHSPRTQFFLALSFGMLLLVVRLTAYLMPSTIWMLSCVILDFWFQRARLYNTVLFCYVLCRSLWFTVPQTDLEVALF